MKRWTRWPVESIDWAMSLKGTMGARAAERETGIPWTTIRGWWSGRADPYRGPGTVPGTQFQRRTRCRRGHSLPPAIGSGRRECRICRRQRQRAYYARRAGRFHPRWNPDPELAPMHYLWIRCRDVLDLVSGRWPLDEVPTQLDKSSGSYRRWQEVLSGRKAWLRLDSADALLAALGLVLSEFPVEPTYSTTTPRENA